MRRQPIKAVIAGIAMLLVPAVCLAQAAAPGAASRPAAPESSGTREPTVPEAKVPESKAREGSGSSTEDPSGKLDRSDGVIRPPAGVDPEIAQTPPPTGPRSTPVIPPLGAPGGPPGVTAK